MNNLTFLRGGEGAARGPPFKKNILFINDKHIKMLFFKFHHNHTIKKEFDFWGVKGDVSILCGFVVCYMKGWIIG